MGLLAYIALAARLPPPCDTTTGFVCVGKTSLLNAILRDGFNGRIAAIVNEFGYTGFDYDLVKAVSEEVILMQSDC